MEELVECSVCHQEFEYGSMYECRGKISCGDCFDECQKIRDAERQDVIEESRHLTDRFKGLDLSDSQIGKANREILKPDIEIASKESARMKNYEGKS